MEREPYVGPRPFEETEEAIFFGRTQETNEIVSLIISHPLTLLYSQSGAGKTSLLKASLVPLLKRRRFQVFPPVRVRGSQDAYELGLSELTNIYVFNALRYLAPEIKDLKEQGRLLFADYLTSSDVGEKRGVLPIRVLIFDQFEEIFTLYPERFENRKDFFDQISSLLQNDPLLRIVLAMREDYIAELDPYAPYLPEKLTTRYRLLRLNEESARSAIEDPLENLGHHQGVVYLFDTNATNKLIDSLRTIVVKQKDVNTEVLGPFIEPVHLQMVCQALWIKLEDSFRKQILNGANQLCITPSDVNKYGDVNATLIEAYEQAIRKAVLIVMYNSDGSTRKINEEQLRSWFSRILITRDGTRSTVFSSRNDNEINGIPKVVVQELEKNRMLRSELRGGEVWFEISHDRLVKPILESNEKWLKTLPFDVKDQIVLEERASKWVENRNKKVLLKQEDLQWALKWVERADNSKIIYSDSVLAFIQASKSAQQNRKFRFLIGGLILIVLVTLAIGVTLYSNLKASLTMEQQRSRIFLERQKLVRAYGEVGSVVSSNGSYAVTSFRGSGFNLYNLELRKVIHSSTDTSITSVQFSPSGKLVIINRKENRLFQIYSIAKMEMIFEHQEGQPEGRLVAFSPDEKLVFTGGLSQAPVIWNLETSKMTFLRSNSLMGPVAGGSFSPNGSEVLSWGSRGINLFLATNGAQIGSSMKHQGSCLGASFSYDGMQILSWGAENAIRIWSASSQKQIIPAIYDDESISDAVYSGDGKYILFWRPSGLSFVHARAGKTIALTKYDGIVYGAHFAPDNHHAISWGDDNSLRIWEVQTGYQSGKMTGHSDAINSVTFSRDGKWLFTCSDDGTARIWDIESRRLLRILKHANPVIDIVPSVDGKKIITITSDGIIRSWDTVDFQSRTIN